MMTTVILYRVERENGDGMYRPGDADDFSSPFNDVVQEWKGASPDRHNEYNTTLCKYHALPIEDPAIFPIMLRVDSRLYYFAFSSREQLDAWICIPEWKAGLRAKGFAVSVYSVSESCAAIGDSQAVFIKERATLIERVDLTEF